MRILAFAMGLALALASVGVARATEVQFTITSATGDQIATFELDFDVGRRSPRLFCLFSICFASCFWNKEIRRRIRHDGYLLPIFPARNFTHGPESNPTFLPGSYQVSDVKHNTDTVTVNELSDPPVIDPPVVDPPAVAAPELSTWAMLLLGFVGLGYAGYRKTRTSVIN